MLPTNTNEMNPPISDLLLYGFSSFLTRKAGITFEKERWHQFRKGIEAASLEFGFSAPANCIKWLMSSELSREQLETLASHLTIIETYFFREKKSFDAFENKILPQLIQALSGEKKRVRIWSAACSSGEEPYTIAMILDKKKEALENVSTLILATDINREALDKARKGIYREWSFRTISPLLKEKHFLKKGENCYEIEPHLKESVIFDYFNLVDMERPTIIENSRGMDIIFCRNVLIYFSKKTAARVVANLCSCLRTGGWLIVGTSDAFNVEHAELLRQDIKDVPIYRKIPTCCAINAVTTINKSRLATQEVSQAPQSQYEEALQFYNQGFYKQTVEILQNLLTPQTDTPELYALTARSFFHMGQSEEAEKWFQKAIAADTYNEEYRFLVAAIQLETKRERDAVISLKQCLYINNGFLPAYFLLGKIKHRNKNYHDAERYLDKALSLLAHHDEKEKVMEIKKSMTAGQMTQIIKNLRKKESLSNSST